MATVKLRSMPRYRADEPSLYFCTVTILDWLPVFIEDRYIDPVIDSLQFCRLKKNLKLFSFVVMPNHVHLIAECGDDLHPVMRDFKRFTSRTIHDRLVADGRKTLLKWLSDATERARVGRGEFSLWRSGFAPKGIFSRHVLQQKMDYLHQNPVRKGLVRMPEDWWYSSAAFYEGCKAVCKDMDSLDF